MNKKEQPLKLSVLIPVFNEEYTVDEILDKVRSVELPGGLQREIVAVDDCSRDKTRQRLQEYAAKHPDVQVFWHDVNQGKGAAIRTAIEKATGDIIIIQDADLEYDPDDYPRLLKPILNGDADVVYGSRFLASEYKRVLFFWHSWGNHMLTLFSNILTDLDLTDMETCYKVVRADILKSIPIRCNRFGIEPELTAKFAKRGCRIYEVPISYRGRTYQEGKKITWWDGVKALCIMLWFWLVDDIYNEQYGHRILHQLSHAHRFNRWMAETIKPWVGESVLEIGAGMGTMTQRMLPRQRYVSSDIDPLHLHYLRNLYSDNRRVEVAEVDVEKAEHFEPHRGQFDTVVCLNVLEHVKEDVAAMRNILSALKPGGRACILVPRSMALYGSSDEVLEHQRRYTEEELAAKLKEAGFTVDKMFSFNRATVPAWFINGRVFKRKDFSRVQLKIFDSMIFILRKVDWLLPWKGLSLIAIARRPESA